MKLMILIIRKTRLIRCGNKKIIVPLQKYFNRISYSIKYLKCYCRSWSARMKSGFFVEVVYHFLQNHSASHSLLLTSPGSFLPPPYTHFKNSALISLSEA